jgi:hypothetical protein
MPSQIEDKIGEEVEMSFVCMLVSEISAWKTLAIWIRDWSFIFLTITKYSVAVTVTVTVTVALAVNKNKTLLLGKKKVQSVTVHMGRGHWKNTRSRP